MHYKKASWKDAIDPAFDSFIEFYLRALKQIHLPANEGFLALELEENQIKQMEMEHLSRHCVPL